MSASAILAALVTLVPLGSSQDVVLDYQSTYLSSEQLATLPPAFLAQLDPQSGDSVGCILAGPGNGIPSLSHTWITGRRTLRFQWAGVEHARTETETISWLPDAQLIGPGATFQVGRNFTLVETEDFLAYAASQPVAEFPPGAMLRP